MLSSRANRSRDRREHTNTPQFQFYMYDNTRSLINTYEATDFAITAGVTTHNELITTDAQNEAVRSSSNTSTFLRHRSHPTHTTHANDRSHVIC